MWCRVGDWFADFIVVNRVPNVGGRVMVWHNLRTTNTIDFIDWKFECTDIPWQGPEAHCRAFHPRHHLFIQHEQWTMLQRSVHNSWLLKMSQFFHGLHLTRHFTHWACLGCSGSMCVQWRVPVPNHFTVIEEEWANIPQATIKWWSYQTSTPLPFFKLFVTNRCISVFPVMWKP